MTYIICPRCKTRVNTPRTRSDIIGLEWTSEQTLACLEQQDRKAAGDTFTDPADCSILKNEFRAALIAGRI